MTTTRPKKTVLIVDDDTSLLEVLSTAFERAGWEVACSVDGEEVFRKFTAYGPFGLLVDIHMPKINGVEVCRLIKGHPVWKDVFFVVMSGKISERDEEALRASGADEILRKPFDPAAVVDLFDKACAGG
jgi:CheY-like chemotaxis protein